MTIALEEDLEESTRELSLFLWIVRRDESRDHTQADSYSGVRIQGEYVKRKCQG